MTKIGKKHLHAKELVANKQVSLLNDGLAAVLDASHVKFDESVDVDIVLGVDSSKGDQSVRGSALLPHGTGKNIRVLVFAKGEKEEEARNAGADYVGAEDLVEKILGGWLDFEVAVATPDIMGLAGKVARILGPRGLLPNKKIGTVTFDVASIVRDLKKGRVSYRNDKGGVLHAPFGRVSFGVEKLAENLKVLVKAINASKPPSSKGRFIRKIVVSSTMGPGVELSLEGVI